MLTISAGHFGKGTGARGFLDEGEGNIEVVKQLGKKLSQKGIITHTIIDTHSKNKQQNLTYLISQHNATQRHLDVSIHFNATAEKQKSGIGTEVLYMNPAIMPFAQKMSRQVAKAGRFKDRGAKLRKDLAFLKGTAKKAIIIEICFVSSEEDIQLYRANKEQIIEAIADTLKSYLSGTTPIPKQTPTISSPALQQAVETLFNDKLAVRQQLEHGIQSGAYQQIWLDYFEQGKLTLYDYLALTALQFQKNKHFV
ncbi:N-acetylmuramoyl-L-alanine amidase [Solibacillus sp. FSL W8-0372]|uniref:N-acetylmuramoyl-L-alanine amidase n=1 Tax=Solibacillus sp. FSL W8-0372 TaxID=2921713 RepID=UPI0030D4AB2A